MTEIKDDGSLAPLVPTELVARLEAASAGSRELDWAVNLIEDRWLEGCTWQPFGYVDINGHPPDPHEVCWTNPTTGKSNYTVVPPLTTCVTAALELAERVLPGWAFEITGGFGLSPARVETARDRWAHYDNADAEDGGVVVIARTIPLALCIAILKATTAPSQAQDGYEADAIGEVNQDPSPPEKP